MRQVSGTHRVALDWLYDRINLDPKIQTLYIDTKHQTPDCGHVDIRGFRSDEWNNILHLFNISHFSCKIEIYRDELVFSCSDKFLIRKKSDCVQKSGDTHSYGET